MSNVLIRTVANTALAYGLVYQMGKKLNPNNEREKDGTIWNEAHTLAEVAAFGAISRCLLRAVLDTSFLESPKCKNDALCNTIHWGLSAIRVTLPIWAGKWAAEKTYSHHRVDFFVAAAADMVASLAIQYAI